MPSHTIWTVCEWLPGADADALEPVSCTYTTTANENFSLDRVGSVVVVAGFSGHGFKFTPAVGRILADLVTTNFSAPNLFALSRKPYSYQNNDTNCHIRAGRGWGC